MVKKIYIQPRQSPGETLVVTNIEQQKPLYRNTDISYGEEGVFRVLRISTSVKFIKKTIVQTHLKCITIMYYNYTIIHGES